MRTARVSLAVAAALLVSVPASAQSTDRPVAVSFGAGVSAASNSSGAALGGTLTFDLGERVVFEGTGSYINGDAGMDALHLSGGVRLNLLPRAGRAVPYAAAAAGVYRASFDMDHARMFGSMRTGGFQDMRMVPLSGGRGWGMMQNYQGRMWNGTWTGPQVGARQMPMFYQNRLGVMNPDPQGRWGHRSFVDPALTLGGGLRLAITESFEIRPDARALLVFGNGDMHTVGVFTFGAGYRF